MNAILLAIVIGASTYLLIQALLSRVDRRRIRRRVSLHVRRAEVAPEPAAQGQRLVARLERLYGATERRLGGTRPWGRLERLVERADVSRRPVELVWIVLGLGVLIGVAVGLAAASFVGVVWGPVIAVAAALAFLSLRARRRLRAFDDQLPDLLGELAASLRAGHSLTQALQVIADDAEEPARSELACVLGETRLGRPLEDALARMSERLPSRELSYVLTAITVQRQVGGSLASLFELVAETVHERQRFERKVRSLTANGRMSAYVLTALPFALAVVLTLLNRSYLNPLFQTSTGRTLVGTALVLMALGALLLKRIVNVRGASA